MLKESYFFYECFKKEEKETLQSWTFCKTIRGFINAQQQAKEEIYYFTIKTARAVRIYVLI